MLPESLKPTTTLSPHHAVEVSLWVNPVWREKAKSLLGSDTCMAPPALSAVAEFENALRKSLGPRGRFAQARFHRVPYLCQSDQVLGSSRQHLPMLFG